MTVGARIGQFSNRATEARDLTGSLRYKWVPGFNKHMKGLILSQLWFIQPSGEQEVVTMAAAVRAI